MGLLYVLIMLHKPFRVNPTLLVNPHSTLCSAPLSILCSCFVTVIAFISFELLFLQFIFALFVCIMDFLCNILLLGNMRHYSKNSSSTLNSEEEAESSIEKGLWSKVHMHSSKLNDLNQKSLLDSSKDKVLFNNDRMDGITVCSYHVI